MKATSWLSPAVMALFLVSILLSATSARGALLAADEFLIGTFPAGYTGTTDNPPTTGSPVGSRLRDQVSPAVFGFTQGTTANVSPGWNGGGGNQYIVDSNTTLSIPGFSSPGGSVYTTFDSTTDLLRPFSASVQTTTDTATDLWFSLMIAGTDLTGTNGLQVDTDGGGLIRMREQTDHFVLQMTGATDAASASGTFVAGTTYLMLGRLQINRSPAVAETLSMWALTNIASFNIGTPLLTTSGNLLNAGDGLVGVNLNKNRDTFQFDSIRLGTTYESVLGIPEPSTFVLAGLGLLGLGCVALRKKIRRA